MISYFKPLVNVQLHRVSYPVNCCLASQLLTCQDYSSKTRVVYWDPDPDPAPDPDPNILTAKNPNVLWVRVTLSSGEVTLSYGLCQLCSAE